MKTSEGKHVIGKFKIAIDGQEYLVEMEEIGMSQTTVLSPVMKSLPGSWQRVTAQPEIRSVHQNQKPHHSQRQLFPADGEPIHSSMPGTILRLLVNVGDTSKKPVVR